MRTQSLGAMVALSLLAGTVSAQEAQQTQQLTDEQRAALDDEARQLFEAGEVAFQNGRFERAYRYFQEAYELSGRELILYNLGLSAELARLDRESLEAYRSYLERVPDSPQHARVRTRVSVLEERLAGADDSGDATGETPAATSGSDTTSSSASSGGGGDALPGWLLFGGGLAVAAVGGVLVGLAAADVSRVEDAPQGAAWAEFEDSANRAEPMNIAGIVLLGVGAATAALGLVLALTSGGGDEEVALRVGPGALALTGSFR